LLKTFFVLIPDNAEMLLSSKTSLTSADTAKPLPKRTGFKPASPSGSPRKWQNTSAIFANAQLQICQK
jgi:hypothetical protein